MTAPSNANTSGLEVVAWTSEEYLADTRLRKHGAYWMWGNPASSASVALVTAASAQAAIDEQEETIESLKRLVDQHYDRATAAEARADRLAKALEPFARVARWARLCGMPDLEKATAKYAKRNLFWDQFSAADTALNGDADHAG